MIVKRLQAAAVLVLGIGVTPALADDADVRQGLAMFRSGQFAEAYRDWAGAADQGDGRAARFLGVMYDAGEGVHQDHGRAVRWYRRAAELGDASGMLNVAVSYDAGTGVPRDHRMAARWYAQAAARHFGRAEYDLALLYQSGDGVRRDPAAAARLFRAAASDGVAAASSHLPVFHVRLVRPTAPDDDTTFRDAQRALLSRRPADMAAAVALFKQTGRHGGPAAEMALYDLAWCYENGAGVQADRTEAYALYVHVAAGTTDPALRDLAEAGAVGTQASPNGSSASAGTPLASHAVVPGTPAGHQGGSSD